MASISALPAAAPVDLPHLREQSRRSLERQARRATSAVAGFVPRPAAVAALDALIHSCGGGLITLEGPPGAGLTALLCHLATTRPLPLWLPQEDPAGAEALCAQILARYRLPVPLVPPGADRDAAVLQRLLGEAAEARPEERPLVVLVGRIPGPHEAAIPPPLPTAIPDGVILVLARAPGDPPPPVTPAAALPLPHPDEDLPPLLARAAREVGCAAPIAERLAALSGGSFLYVRLAAGLVHAGALTFAELPEGLDALHALWWRSLDRDDQQVAALLAAAPEPLDLALAAAALDMPVEDVARRVARWGDLLRRDGDHAHVAHPATSQFIGAATGDQLAEAHGRLVRHALAQAGGSIDRPGWDAGIYVTRNLARHVALADDASRAAAGEAIARRGWLLAQERRTSGHHAGASDMLWELRAAATGPPLRLVRSAALAGSLALLARSLAPDAPAETLAAALEAGQPREATLRRVRGMVDSLPDGRDKAQVLRRLGEVCYALRMRASAMRMLSEALDLEAPGLPRSWRDEREETLVALARAAIAAESPNIALAITTRIVHPERRGMIETEVVRRLLARDQRTRAEEVAYAIGHPGNHEWAMAEVAVGHARGGNFERAGVVLSTLRTETAVAWVTTELACDAAQRGNVRAVDRVALLPNPMLRDRAMGQVALALAVGVSPEAGLDAARMIADDEVRARALVELALAHPAVQGDALDEASHAVLGISGDEQAPVVAALAAAQAALGRSEDALRTATVLPEGEGRDRTHSRIVAALARTGEVAGARLVAEAIRDDDERDWALDELARRVAEGGGWREAFDLAGRIGDGADRARAEADLAIAWARAGEPGAAHARAEQIAVVAERLRAQVAIAVPLAEAGARTAAFETAARHKDPEARSRYLAAAAAALAGAGAVDEAHALAQTIARPLDRARALVAVTRAASAPEVARAALAGALTATATLGRREVFICLGWAADALAAMGGPELLLAAAGALDEIDGWWG